MDLDGNVAASQFGFRYSGVYSHLQSGFDPKYSAYSPGWVLQEEILRQLIADGIKAYDFLGGDEPYKRRWGAVEGRYCAFTCVRPSARTTLVRLAERLQTSTFGILRRVTPRPIWAALRAGYHAWRGPTP
jgi:CelD/BcsL family acetyltransferase involved in cellulose biosynthesis